MMKTIAVFPFPKGHVRCTFILMAYLAAASAVCHGQVEGNNTVPPSTRSDGAPQDQGADPFVRATGSQLTLNGLPFRFAGGNEAGLMFSSNAAVDQVLQTAANNHLNVLRVWAFIDIGNADGSNSVHSKPNGMYFQFWDGTGPAYNDGVNGLANLDYTIYKAGLLGLKLIIPVTNNWTDFGGMDQYVKWRGGLYHDDFYTDPLIRQWYKNWIAHLANRVNSFSGIAYKNDPAIMMWELGNEPRCGGSGPGSGGYPTSKACSTQTLTSWVQDVASYIKNIDPNHLVSAGDEGFYCHPGSRDWIDNCSQGVDTLAFSEASGIDVMGLHLYPEAWGRDMQWSDNYIDQHFIDAASTVGKPAYLGEFGLMTGNTRISVYKDWMDRTFNQGGAGTLFWDLTSGVPSPASSESNSSFDVKEGSPVLIATGNFGQMMAANAVLPFAPVAGFQWASTGFNQPVTLNVLNNDVAYAGNTIDPASIDLDPASGGQQTSNSVYGGTFTVAGTAVQFTPMPGFSGTARGSYTVQDNMQNVSNIAYMAVTVKPSATAPMIIESFETGTDGWGPQNGNAGAVAQSAVFHTDGNFGLAVQASTGGWFGVSFPSTLDLSGRPSLSIDVQTNGVGGGAAIAFQTGSNFNWCQTNDPWPTIDANNVTTVTIALDPAQIHCFNGAPNFAQVHTFYVFLSGPGTFFLDNLRAAAPVNAASPITVESFETGDDGWHSINGKPSSVSQTPAFHTDGSYGLAISDDGGSDWFGFALPSPLNISGHKTLTVDLQTVGASTQTAIAIQTGSGFTWCQTASFGTQPAGSTDTVTLNLVADCASADLTSLRAVWVWIGGGGVFNVDNLRVQ